MWCMRGLRVEENLKGGIGAIAIATGAVCTPLACPLLLHTKKMRSGYESQYQETHGEKEGEREASSAPSPAGREFFIDNLLVRDHFMIEMIRWAGLAP